MDIITALAVVIGIMGGIATWLAVTMGNAYVLIWAIFIAWASFYGAGGKEAGLQKSAVANIWGAICAAVALIVAQAMGVNALTAGLCVGVSVIVMILGAKVPALGAIPSAVYGYASTAALCLMGGALGGGAGAIVQAAIAIAVSMVIGNILGYVSEKIAGSLVKS
jgi:Protein of unknown function (DUF1097)